MIKVGLGKNASQEPAQTREKPEKLASTPVFLGLSTFHQHWANPCW
jgi:hypothetical protein